MSAELVNVSERRRWAPTAKNSFLSGNLDQRADVLCLVSPTVSTKLQDVSRHKAVVGKTVKIKREQKKNHRD
jgi:hypothetical protein